MWRRKDHRLKRINEIFTLDRVEGLALVNQSFDFNKEVCPDKWLFLGRKSVYKNDHDKIREKKRFGTRGWVKEPKVQAWQGRQHETW